MRTAIVSLVLCLYAPALIAQEHAADQFAGTEAWFTKQISLGRVEQNRCDVWLVFGVERNKQTKTEFVRVDYLSLSSQPLGSVDEAIVDQRGQRAIAALLATADSMARTQ